MDVKKLEPIPDFLLPERFADAVKMLTRPYYPITEEQVDYLREVAKRENTDVFEDENGRQYTWGYADGVTQLMPIQDRFKREGGVQVKNHIQICKHDDGTISFWTVELSAEDATAIDRILEKYIDEGYNCRGGVEPVLNDLKDILEEM